MSGICPAIMQINPFYLQESLRQLYELDVKILHADILDGVFAPYISMGQKYYEMIAKESKIPVEVHFQVDDPTKQIQMINPQILHRIIFHVEKIDEQSFNTLTKYCNLCAVGVAINPTTDFESILSQINLNIIDKIVIMASSPGFSVIDDNIFKKIKAIDNYLVINKYRDRIKLQVDAGVRESNIQQFRLAGADEFVCASAIFNADDSIKNNYLRLLAQLNISTFN
jgi:ribulose-phosphate 3-epimerase